MIIFTTLWGILVKLYRQIRPDKETARLLIVFMPLVILFFGIIVSDKVTNLVYQFAVGIYQTFGDFIGGFVDIFSTMVNFSFINFI